METTICAIATAIGGGAISIIRCSGPEAIKIVKTIFKGQDLNKVQSHTINYGFIVDKDEIIDEVLVSVMKSPRSFTMEDVVEINSHGGIAITNKILDLLLTNGCQLAEPGEFTKRAFLNGHIDLLKAEAIGDLISSENEKARKLAINQLTGLLSRKVNNIRSQIISTQAHIEVNIDYPEYEDIEMITNDLLLPKLLDIQKELELLLKEAENGKMIKNGINVTIIGQPNVGKSSILNALLKENKAIVTNIPGTTRDAIEGKLLLNGITLNIIDTAGIRQTEDYVEKIGVQKSIELSDKADLIIYVVDNSAIDFREDEEYLKKINEKKVIVFINKDDITLGSSVNRSEIFKKYNLVKGNTISETGLNQLKNKIVELFNLKYLETKDFTYLSNARQISLTKMALDSILNAINGLTSNMPIDMITIDLKNCYEYLGEIIGETYKDDLLNEIFSKFCLGK